MLQKTKQRKKMNQGKYAEHGKKYEKDAKEDGSRE